MAQQADDMREALAGAALIISSFRNKLCAAAYPFAEPPGVSAILADIDRLMYPEEVEKRKKKNNPANYVVPTLEKIK